MIVEKVPIFIQIKEDYKRLIDKGLLKEGDLLPSVREIALAYSINPNTAQRAFTLLAEEGYIESIPKKGFYVKRKNVKEDQLKDLLKEILDSGYTKEEIKKELEEWQDD